MRVLRRVGSAATILGSIALIGIVVVLFGAIAAGYRPVVILTGSMGDTAPPGALVIAAPRAATDVQVGDVLVMRRPGTPTITHRVVEIESNGDARFAITKGDANEAIDATPHPLDSEQLVGRWYFPGWGRRLQAATQPQYALTLVAAAVVAITFGVLRRIWRPQSAAAPGTTGPSRAALRQAPLDPAARRRRRMAKAAIPITVVTSIGVAWALFRADDAVTANTFGTADCFDPQLGSVQSGSTIHAIDGTMTVAITPVDPTEAFVMATVRSDAGDPVDSTVQVRLSGGGTEIELFRSTDAPVAPPVTVSWSVVEYSCGITVQRGVTTGDGDTMVDVAITPVNAGQSFVLVSSADVASATAFGADDLIVGELAGASTLQLRSGANLSSTRSLAWQVVTFDDPGDIDVQHLTVAMTAGQTSRVVSLPGVVDPSTTFLLAGITTTGDGPDIGARMIRAHMSSGTTVEVSRQLAGEALDVHLQVVTLHDGSTVRHGTVDLDAGQPARTVTFPPVDPTRSTAFSTVAIPGPVAGGSTSMATDDRAGEATATFELLDHRTLQLTRDATASDASFGWQVVEWAGPGWWDDNWRFRQRIDVVTDTAAAPGGYTVPVTIDHGALVTNGMARIDGNDVRVLRWSGMAWTELDRILDEGSSWNGTTTTLLFRTDLAVAASDRDSYWLYFGNDTPTAPPTDEEAVFALVEDFDDGTLGDFEDRTAGGAWYQAQPWTYRRSLTVPAGAVGSDLSDFPLLVEFTDGGLASALQPDASDLRFTAADGTTVLDHEIESWDPMTGSLAAWVRVPSLPAATATTIRLFAGAADAPDGQATRTVWPTDIDGVWHLADDPAGSAPHAADSGRRRLGGLSHGAMTASDLVVGAAGLALELDGIDDVVEVPAAPVGAAGGFSVGAWIRPDAFGGDASVVVGDDSGMPVVHLRVQGLSPTTAAVLADAAIGGVSTSATGGVVSAGSWHHVAATFDGTELVVFVDGVAGTPTPAMGAISQPSGTMQLGSGPAGAFDGVIDEVRIDQVARSSAWLEAHVANIADPGFVIEGAVESGSWLGQGAWGRRKPLLIEAGSAAGAVADQAVFVRFTDADLASGARSDAADIVFTAEDAVTRLDHVVEVWNSATGELGAWVSMPALTSSDDTTFFVYYGNPTARDQQDATAVFGSDADLVTLPE